MRKEICLGDRVFVYEFTRKRVKNLNLRVRGDGSVAVSAPLRMPIEQVESFLRKKEDFLLRALAKVGEREVPVPPANGVEIPYLGKSLRLRFEKAKRYSARQEGAELILAIPKPEEEQARTAALKRWETEESRRLMAAMLERIYPVFEPYGVPKTSLRVRTMRSRWGSCMPKKGVVTLNTRLLAYSEDCMEYIMVHELCHFLQADHSAKFYAWMDRFLPDWRQRRQELREME